MKIETQDTRKGSIDVPPSRLGRLLQTLRETVGQRGMSPHAEPSFRKKVAETKLKGLGLSRLQAADWALEIGGIDISERQIQRVETGERRSHDSDQLRGLLRAYGLSKEEVDAVVADPELNSKGGGNPHLISEWKLRGLAVYEFGPLITEALKIGDRCSTWIEVEKAGWGGYQTNEISLIVEEGEIKPDAKFRKIADDAFLQNEAKKEKVFGDGAITQRFA